MVNIPYIKISQIHIRGISSARSIYPAQESECRISTIPPTPITYLTQWKIVGNSEVHGVGNLTSWKVSGNSVVDNNTILSCGDYSDVDGKYHVKISNGVTIYDIPLTEPLRKVNDVADTIEFPSETEGKALVTRSLKSVDMGTIEWFMYYSSKTQSDGIYCLYGLLTDGEQVSQDDNTGQQNILTPRYVSTTFNKTYSISSSNDKSISYGYTSAYHKTIRIQDSDYNQSDSAAAYKTAVQGTELIYKLATPITEFIDVSPFPVSPTDTYTSANVVPYSAFEHTENKEIWSCGEYNSIDGKYHILVQPLGGSIADIALDEPLRKVNDVADTIEFPSSTEGKALVIRPLNSIDAGYYRGIMDLNPDKVHYRYTINVVDRKPGNTRVVLTPGYTTSKNPYASQDKGIVTGAGEINCYIMFYNNNYCQSDSADAFRASLQGKELIYELATPTTELVDAPQIEKAESYSMVISQGGKAVEWSSFASNPS